MAQELIDKIRAAAQAKGIDPDVALNIARSESSLQPAAKAGKSTAGGLFQVVDKTWKEFGGAPGKKFDPEENIRVGTDIIAKNTQTLKSFLQRDPKPAEVYAAHYFGPTGAKNFLSAQPGTPISDVFSKEVILANPNLKGKTTDQVMAQLEKKMGSSPAPKAAPVVSRETPAEQTPAEKIMEPALRSGMSAQAPVTPDKMAGMGAGYQAALALSFLADTDEKEDRDIDREPGIAEKWLAQQPAPSTTLADISSTSIKSPFAAEPQPTAMMAHGGEVQHLAGGGMPYAPTAMVRPSVKKELEDIKSQYDTYNTQANLYNTGLTKYQTEVAAPYERQAEEYNKAAEAYNLGPRTSDFTMAMPTAPAEYSMAAPTAPTVSAADYEAKGLAARKDLQNRNLALQVMANPEQYGLSVDRMFADGGEVAEPNVLQVSDYSRSVAQDMYPGQQGQFDQQDAARHMLAAGTLARKYGATAADMMGNLHEITTSPLRWAGSKMGISQMPVDYEQDLHNNRIGIELAKRSKSQKDLEDLVQQMAEQAKGQPTQGRPWTGKPVRRADGGPAEPTPEEIEAASRPATVNPNIQRQGEAARRLAAMRDVNALPDPKTYAAVSGFLGTPPDEQGFSVMHPQREGIKQAGEAGFYAGTAAQVAPMMGALRAVGVGPSSAGKGATAAQQLGAIKVPGRAQEPLFSPTPSSEAPFVGRLDEMVANLQGPVQKEQFLGMLKGKMRDYDIARAESTLADLPGNAKLSPVDLLNRIKTQYDPSQFKTTVIPPGKPGDFYQSMDNPYIGSTKDGQPLGVIHLSQGLPAGKAAQAELVKDAGLALSRIATHGGFSAANPQIADDLFKFLQNPGVPLSEATSAKMTEVAQNFRKAAEFDKGWTAAKESIMYPILDPRWNGLRENYAKDLAAARNTGYYDADVQDIASGMATRDISQQGNQWLAANGFAPVNLPDFTTLKDAAVHVGTNPDLTKAVRVAFDDARAVNKDFLKDVREEAKQARMMFGDDTRAIQQYQGQHPSLNNPPSPISFSRFSEHTTEIPGIGKAEGIYVNELQSDLLDDLRKQGTKGGSLEKDERRLADAQARMKASTDPSEQKALESQIRRLGSRLYQGMGPNKKPKEGFYQLAESFPGMENSPQVAQQLMVKNAVSGAMQMGKQFVAFPGAESAQAQLYEKLGPNLKSVVKDLGPGFELRDVTLRDPDGRQLMHKAIVWGPEAATRIQKKGVPFKDGGAVERQTADHRKYL